MRNLFNLAVKANHSLSTYQSTQQGFSFEPWKFYNICTESKGERFHCYTFEQIFFVWISY